MTGDKPGRQWTRRGILTLGAVATGAALGADFPRSLFAAARSNDDGPTPPRGAAPEGTVVPSSDGGTITATTAPQPIRRSIAEENARPGTEAWQIFQLPEIWDRVRGYASRTSIAPGEPFDVFVGTAGTTFTVSAFRMGHYQGKGGRLVWTSGPQTAARQPAARVDPKTNLRDAPWSPSLRIEPDDEWVPGAYLLKLESDDGGQSQIPLVVRDDDHPAAVHIQHDVTTWQAYNRWGGACLYDGDNGRSKVVSFDRPYDNSGSGHFLGGCYEIGALVESLGLDVTYSTNLDTHARPESVANAKVWISPAHDEYWSPEMRNGVTAARDTGTNLMFLGANAVYRRIRLEDSPLGPHRHVVNYRTAAEDPLHGKDDDRVTTSWREAPNPRPESDLTGTYYESNPVEADMVIVAADAWMFAGTGVTNGDRWVKLVGNEYDRVTPGAPTPATIQVLAHSPVVCKGRHSFADMTYYTTAGGAGVFSAGSIWFERHLHPDGAAADRPVVAMVTNILRVFAAGPAGTVHPAVPNLDALGIRAGGSGGGTYGGGGSAGGGSAQPAVRPGRR